MYPYSAQGAGHGQYGYPPPANAWIHSTSQWNPGGHPHQFWPRSQVRLLNDPEGAVTRKRSRRRRRHGSKQTAESRSKLSAAHSADLDPAELQHLLAVTESGLGRLVVRSPAAFDLDPSSVRKLTAAVQRFKPNSPNRGEDQNLLIATASLGHSVSRHLSDHGVTVFKESVHVAPVDELDVTHLHLKALKILQEEGEELKAGEPRGAVSFPAWVRVLLRGLPLWLQPPVHGLRLDTGLGQDRRTSEVSKRVTVRAKADEWRRATSRAAKLYDSAQAANALLPPQLQLRLPYFVELDTRVDARRALGLREQDVGALVEAVSLDSGRSSVPMVAPVLCSSARASTQHRMAVRILCAALVVGKLNDDVPAFVQPPFVSAAKRWADKIWDRINQAPVLEAALSAARDLGARVTSSSDGVRALLQTVSELVFRCFGGSREWRSVGGKFSPTDPLDSTGAPLPLSFPCVVEPVGYGVGGHGATQGVRCSGRGGGQCARVVFWQTPSKTVLSLLEAFGHSSPFEDLQKCRRVSVDVPTSALKKRVRQRRRSKWPTERCVLLGVADRDQPLHAASNAAQWFATHPSAVLVHAPVADQQQALHFVQFMALLNAATKLYPPGQAQEPITALSPKLKTVKGKPVNTFALFVQRMRDVGVWLSWMDVERAKAMNTRSGADIAWFEKDNPAASGYSRSSNRWVYGEKHPFHLHLSLLSALLPTLSKSERWSIDGSSAKMAAKIFEEAKARFARRVEALHSQQLSLIRTSLAEFDCEFYDAASEEEKQREAETCSLASRIVFNVPSGERGGLMRESLKDALRGIRFCSQRSQELARQKWLAAGDEEEGEDLEKEQEAWDESEEYTLSEIAQSTAAELVACAQLAESECTSPESTALARGVTATERQSSRGAARQSQRKAQLRESALKHVLFGVTTLLATSHDEDGEKIALNERSFELELLFFEQAFHLDAHVAWAPKKAAAPLQVRLYPVDMGPSLRDLHLRANEHCSFECTFDVHFAPVRGVLPAEKHARNSNAAVTRVISQSGRPLRLGLR